MTGYLYVIGCDDAVKVGWSKDPARRFRSIKTDNHAALELLGYVKATLAQEKNFHRLLAPWRIRREWYKREGGVLILLDRLPPPPPETSDARRVFSANGNPLARYRQQTRETLEQVSSRIGVARNTIWRWEQGRAPDPKVWPAIIKATTITRQQLLRYAMAKKYAEAAE